MISIVLILLIVPNLRAEYELIFSDEFDNLNSIDQNKWDVTHEDQRCKAKYELGQLNCRTNSTHNIRIVNGTLVLAAIKGKEPYLGLEYTAPLITTKRDFTHAKFEIRAALPIGKMLRPSIYLEPYPKIANRNPWSYDGLIEIANNVQNKKINCGIHFASGTGNRYIGADKRSIVNESLNNFNEYIMEWTEFEIKWYFNGRIIHEIDIQTTIGEIHNPFARDKSFKLVISLGVGGSEFFPA